MALLTEDLQYIKDSLTRFEEIKNKMNQMDELFIPLCDIVWSMKTLIEDCEESITAIHPHP